MSKELLTLDELATLLRVSTKTLYRWRENDEGPPFVRMGRAIGYPRRDLNAWLDERTRLKRDEEE